MDDDIIDDGDFTAAAQATERPRAGASAGPASRTNGTDGAPKKVTQPKPQALAQRQGASSILVSTRQKGNPVLNNIKSMPWEYSDIPADFVIGATSCALFLSLKYHRLHPEYIYQRIKALGGKYNLRILLTMVDIPNHEEPLKELSKTSLINNVTVILTWSAQEAGRYLELYKSYEFAQPTSIKAHQSTSYSDQLVEFVTVPRSINKTDAVSLVSNFGSIRTAINARPEEIALVAGWGEKKVQRWCQVVREPFRIQKTAKRGLDREDSRITPALSRDVTRDEVDSTPALSRAVTEVYDGRDAQVAARLGIGGSLPLNPGPPTVDGNTADADKRAETRIADDFPAWEPGAEEEEALAAIDSAPIPPAQTPKSATNKRAAENDELSEGVMAALSKLRKT